MRNLSTSEMKSISGGSLEPYGGFDHRPFPTGHPLEEFFEVLGDHNDGGLTDPTDSFQENDVPDFFSELENLVSWVTSLMPWAAAALDAAVEAVYDTGVETAEASEQIAFILAAAHEASSAPPGPARQHAFEQAMGRY